MKADSPVDPRTGSFRAILGTGGKDRPKIKLNPAKDSSSDGLSQEGGTEPKTI